MLFLGAYEEIPAPIIHPLSLLPPIFYEAGVWMVEEDRVVGSVRSHLGQCGRIYLHREQENWRQMVREREGWHRLLHPVTAWHEHTPEDQKATMEGARLSRQDNSEQAALVKVGIGEEADLEPDLPHHPSQQWRDLKDPSENSSVGALGEPAFRHPSYRGSITKGWVEKSNTQQRENYGGQ